MFVYEHAETIEYVKRCLLFKVNTNFTGKFLREFLGLKMWNFKSIVITWTRIHTKISKSALMYLESSSNFSWK